MPAGPYTYDPNAYKTAYQNTLKAGGNTQAAVLAGNNAYRDEGEVDALNTMAASNEEKFANEQASANAAAAERTNALAMKMATVRRKPGGGLRQGMPSAGVNAGMAGASGLTAANIAGRKTRALQAGEAAVTQQFRQRRRQQAAAWNQSAAQANSLGQMIRIY